MSEFAVPVTALYGGILGLILLVLSILVVRARIKSQVTLGDQGPAGDDGLTRACRAFGNATEYVPIVLILLLILELMGAHLWLLHALGLIFVLSRIGHGAGLHSTSGRSLGRMLGTLGTWACLLAGSIAAIYHAFL